MTVSFVPRNVVKTTNGSITSSRWRACSRLSSRRQAEKRVQLSPKAAPPLPPQYLNLGSQSPRNGYRNRLASSPNIQPKRWLSPILFPTREIPGLRTRRLLTGKANPTLNQGSEAYSPERPVLSPNLSVHALPVGSCDPRTVCVSNYRRPCQRRTSARRLAVSPAARDRYPSSQRQRIIPARPFKLLRHSSGCGQLRSLLPLKSLSPSSAIRGFAARSSFQYLQPRSLYPARSGVSTSSPGGKRCNQFFRSASPERLSLYLDLFCGAPFAPLASTDYRRFLKFRFGQFLFRRSPREWRVWKSGCIGRIASGFLPPRILSLTTARSNRYA